MCHLLNTFSYGAGAYLFLNEELSDVVIIVKTDAIPWRFPAHCLILSAQSRVFRCMLQGDFAENSSRQIIIEDIHPSTVERLLRYMYFGKADLENWKEAIDLLKAAHKYQLDPLVEICGKFLENVITLTNVCYLFDESTTYNLQSMREKCLQLILDAGFIVLRSKTFNILSKECVLEIVASSSLNVDCELTVFEALLHWAPMQCCRTGKEVSETNILLELQPFLPHVCFDDMSDTDKSALPSSILSCVQPNNRNRVLFTVPASLLSHSHRLRFKVGHITSSTVSEGIPRGYGYPEDYVDLPYSERNEGLICMRFTIDAPIELISFGFVVLSREIPAQFPLTIKKDNAANTVIQMFNMGSAPWREGIRINDMSLFDTEYVVRQPVLLKEKIVYKLVMNIHLPTLQCLKTSMVNETIFTSSGSFHFTVHSDTWGITSLNFLSACR